MFDTVDFYGFGREAGQEWRRHYQERHANIGLTDIASAIQSHTYHLRRSHFSSEVINAWEHGFRVGAQPERETHP